MKFILTIVLTLVCVGYYVWSVEGRLSAIARIGAVEVKTQWKSGGVTQEVRTSRGEFDPNETEAEHEARHFQKVHDKRIEFPPDP